MSDIQVADATAGTGFSASTNPVVVRMNGLTIGHGTVETTDDGVSITGQYQWPVNQPPVSFSYRFRVKEYPKCSLEADWPNLLPARIHEPDSTYIMLLVAARPRYIISSPGGAGSSLTYVGPFGQPGIITALQVSAGNDQGSAQLDFVLAG